MRVAHALAVYAWQTLELVRAHAGVAALTTKPNI